MSSKETDYHIIRFVVEYVTDEDGIKEAVHSTKKVKKASVKRYMSNQHKHARLTKCAEMLLRFLTEEMDEANNISHTQMLRTRFRDHMKKDCSLEFTDDTVKKAFYSLVNEGLIIKYGSRLDYTVNPMCYFKGSEEKRVKILTQLLRFARTAPSSSNVKSALGL